MLQNNNFNRVGKERRLEVRIRASQSERREIVIFISIRAEFFADRHQIFLLQVTILTKVKETVLEFEQTNPKGDRYLYSIRVEFFAQRHQVFIPGIPFQPHRLFWNERDNELLLSRDR